MKHIIVNTELPDGERDRSTYALTDFNSIDTVIENITLKLKTTLKDARVEIIYK